MYLRRKKFKGYLVLAFLLILSFVLVSATALFIPQNSAFADDEDSPFDNLGSLLFSDYASQPSTSKRIFDGDVLADIYERITGIPYATYDDVKSMASGKLNANDFRSTTISDGQDMTVMIDGKEWTITYLSLNNAGEPILTLWQNTSAVTSNWNNYQGGYITSNMYGCSQIRNLQLNNPGGYCASNGAGSLTTYTQNENNVWAKFTMDSVDGSLTSYIEAPNNVSWQRSQSAIDELGYAYNLNNDALDVGGNGQYGSYANHGWYKNWANDKIWLPSITEAGLTGMWDTSVAQRKNETTTWLRSATHNYYIGCYQARYNGLSHDTYHVQYTFAVRPAFHLKLKEAQEHSSRRVRLVDVEKEYTGSPLGVEGEDWFTRPDLANNATVTYYDKSTSAALSSKPTNVGEYEAEITLTNTGYFWEDDMVNSTNKVRFTIVKKKIPFPKFIDGEDTLPYNGGDDVEFQLETFEDYRQYINISVPGKYGNEVKYNDANQAFTAKKVGKYEMTVTLPNPNTQWASGVHKLEFEVTKATVFIFITDEDGSSQMSGEKGAIIKVDLEQDHNMVPHDGKSVKMAVYASADKLPTIKISDDITLTNKDMSYEVELDLASLRANTTYTLEARTDSEEYAIDMDETTLDVKESPARVMLTWNLYSNGSKVRNIYKDKLLSDTDKTESLDDAITYDGKAYSMKVKAPRGYSVDTTKGIKGYKVEYANDNNGNVGTNADKYTTTVWLKDNSDNSVEEYSISWEIVKAKYDLSKVKWEHDGQLPYDKVNGSKAVLDPKTLLEGLLGIYEANEGQNVGQNGTAYVTFKLDDGYDGNYVLPNSNDPDSYIDDPEEGFEWTKTWIVVKAKIQTGSWKNVTHMDGNNNAFDVKVLRDPLADDGIVEYVYYETDSNGKKLNDTPINADDIIYSASEVKFYVAKPVLVDDKNYELDDPNAESRWFKVGRSLTKVIVDLEKKELEYNTNPRHVKLIVGGESILPTSAFVLTYYEGYTKLGDAPKEVGKYRVDVALKNEYASQYEIDGEYNFEFEIIRSTIAIDWNTQAKPNVLKLKFGQIAGVEYEIVDSDDNEVAYNELKVGVTYRIKAKIKQDQKNHFIFDNGEYETDWQEFSVSETDKLIDPNDSKNPHYPQIDNELPADDGSNPNEPNNDGSDDNKGGGSIDLGNVGQFLKQWWQVIASAISIVLIIIFVGKTIGYQSRKKKAKKAVKDKYAVVFAAAPGLFGWAMSAWTAIACVLMALAVVTFVIMILSKNQCKKAESELADSKDEYNKMVFMRMMNNQGGMNQGAQSGFAYAAQPGLGADEIRGIVSETMTAMLPGMQQLLPQQASGNDELVEKLIEQNEKLMEKLAEQPKEKTSDNDEVIKKLVENQEFLMKKMAEQPTERIVEREVASATADDETIKRVLDNQDKLMQKILEMSTAQPQQPQIQVIEKEVPIEKIVEKVVEVPVEVEKIVEKEVKVEVPVEKIVEKEVIKEVKVAAPAKPKKEVAPRLTLDEAYALLSKQQQKYFDGLRQYALSKPNAKEKKSTYSITIGQSTVNPLLKLTIKKDMTVALFKMEDEYLKDIKRDASGDGTKIKVKETEVQIADAQACKAAKNMIDLREDQIDRYNELLKEQRAMKRK